MEISLNARIMRVGNSLALFIPAAASKRLGLEPNEEIAATISKKRKIESGRLLFGALKGKKLAFAEGDRLDARQ